MSRILIVDDDSDILRFSEVLLSSQGHEAVTCTNGLRALEILHAHPVDLIVIDIVMPMMDGFDLLKEIKKLSNVRAPILMLTGRNAVKDVQRAISLGATDYMIKPFDKDIFLAKIAMLLGKQSVSNKPNSQINFAQAAAHARAEIILNGIVTSVSEMGLVLRTNTYLDRNLRVRIQSSIFKEIEIEPPFLRTTLCRVLTDDREFGFEIHVSFVGLDETAMRKIRRWLTARAIAARKVA